MYSVTVVPHQSWTDLAIQCYGNVDAVITLLADNAGADEIDLALPCALPTVLVREDDPIYNRQALQALGGATIATML